MTETKKVQKMKAISIWQPWASLFPAGAKHYETRSWATSFRGPLAIHASKRSVASVMALLPLYVRRVVEYALMGVSPCELPTGAVVATGNLVACHLIDAAFVAGLTETERALGDYTIGRYAWKIRDVVKLPEPVPAKGRQGLWNWDSDAA